MPDPDVLHVAVTLEQCWHPVPGGTATSILRTVAALQRRNDVRVVGVAARHRAPAPAAFRPAVEVRHLPLHRRALYEAWHVLRRPAVQGVTGPVDVVHATTSAIPPKRGPLVVTVHDLAFLHAPEHFSRNGNRFFRQGLDLTRRDADLVLVPSAQTLGDCVWAGIGEDRLRLVPWGVEAPRVTDQERDEVLRRHGIDRPYLLWCGTLEPRKNLPRLLEAFAEVAACERGLDLVLVGPPGWGQAVGAGPRPPADRVRTLGFVPDADLQALYAGARAFAYPSLREGFGMPVLEAMAHGVPVVTSAGTPMESLVGPAGLAVPPTDVDALAGALTEVVGAGHDRYAARAAERAAGRTWAATAAATAAAYAEAAS